MTTRRILNLILILSASLSSLNAQTINIDYANKKQQINMIGADMERSQSFLQQAANPQEIANWLYKDIPYMTCRVSYDKQQEMVKGHKNLGFYDNAIKSMKMVRIANPAVQFYATMKSDYNGYDKENNLADWICDYKPTTRFDIDGYARFLADYLELMHKEGVGIKYLSVSKEWVEVITIQRTVEIIKSLNQILAERNVPIPLYTDPGAWSIDQGVKFVNTAIDKSLTDYFYAFSTHDYGKSKLSYIEFAEACKRAGKFAWNDETNLGSGGRTFGAESKIESQIRIYAKRADMYAAGMNGEIVFENFSRGIKGETRSIYFNAGETGRRMRSYYVGKAFASHIFGYNYIQTTDIDMDGLKSIVFADDKEIAICLINQEDNVNKSVKLNVLNVAAAKESIVQSFDSLTVKEGEFKTLKAISKNSFTLDVKAKSISFIVIPVKANK